MPVECRGSSAHGIRPSRTRTGRPAISMTGRISTVPTRARIEPQAEHDG
jgi:hypothetical protein